MNTATAVAFRSLTDSEVSVLVAQHAPNMAGKLPGQIRRELRASDSSLGGKSLTKVVDFISSTYGEENRRQTLTEAGKAAASGWHAGSHYTKSGDKLVCEFVRPRLPVDKVARVFAQAKALTAGDDAAKERFLNMVGTL